MLPLSKIYGGITFMRNKLFDWRILRQHEFKVPIVVVGNLAVGGTGKTPHTEYIVEEMRRMYHIAVLSRGYKRHSRGFVLATPNSTPRDIGDEAFQMYQKFNGKITIAVCEDRVFAINELLRLDPDIDLIVLDDAFQHRYVKPKVSIVVTEYGRPLYEDHLMPYGRLRESIRGINRADMVIVSKCPDGVTPRDYMLYKKSLNLFPYQHLFFSHFQYKGLQPLFPEQNGSVPCLDWMSEADNILAIAGIGNPRPFIMHLKSYRPRVKVNIFRDHHNFLQKDMKLIAKRFNSLKGENRIIVTTEKDAVRLASNPYFPEELRAVTFFLPIKVEFLQQSESSFSETLKKLIK